MWRRTNHFLQQLVLPMVCALCQAPCDASGLCRGCDAELPRNRTACERCAQPTAAFAGISPAKAGSICGRCLKKRLLLDQIVAPFYYAHPLDSLVLRFKKSSELACGAALAALFAREISQRTVAIALPQAFVPVPLHTARLRERGFDQARLLAQEFAAYFERPLRAELLARVRDTGTQAGLSAAARVKNVRGAFRTPPTDALPEHIALVDDVATTAATLNACAQALKRAGVKRVDAWVLARA